MNTKIRKRWIQPMMLSEVRDHLNGLIEEGLDVDQPITAVLNPDNFKRPDYGFPEDDHELAEVMKDNHEWFCNVFRIRQVWEYLTISGKEYLTLHDLDQILLWSYRIQFVLTLVIVTDIVEDQNEDQA